MEMIHPLAWSVNFWLPTVLLPFVLFVWLVRDPNADDAPRRGHVADDVEAWRVHAARQRRARPQMR